MRSLQDIIPSLNNKELMIFASELGLSVPGGPKAKKDEILVVLKRYFTEKGTRIEDLEKNEKLKKIIDAKRDILSTLSRKELYMLSKKLGLSVLGGSKAKRDTILTALREHPDKKRIEEESKIIAGEKEKKKLRVQATKEDIRYLDKQIYRLMSDISILREKSESMEERLTKMYDVLQKINELSKLHLSKFEDSFTAESLRDFIYAFYEEKNKHDFFGPDTFDKIREGLKNKGFGDIDLIKYGRILSLLSSLMDVTKRVEWGDNLNIFYSALAGEFKKIKGQLSVVPIPNLRKPVCKKLNITAEKFDTLLFQCRRNGWVRLEPGSPIGETEVKYLVSPDGKKYYYVELLESF